ncbi:MAG: helix-turn-helix domain-containing protein [Alphaproteobacteria bacterium]|nr:MAG: helix-turn-helix domain-containing protein [Alphaproteobacteria bacterium]
MPARCQTSQGDLSSSEVLRRVRTAHLICEMAYRYRLGAICDQFVFAFPATQLHLADALGLTSVHVNRMLRTLDAQGFAKIRRGIVEVMDWNGLSEFAEFDPAYLELDIARRIALPPLCVTAKVLVEHDQG